MLGPLGHSARYKLPIPLPPSVLRVGHRPLRTAPEVRHPPSDQLFVLGSSSTGKLVGSSLWPVSAWSELHQTVGREEV